MESDLGNQWDQSYLGRTNVQYPFPLLHSQIQTHGFNGLKPRHKAFLNAYSQMMYLHEQYKDYRGPPVLPPTSVDVYPGVIYTQSEGDCVGKPRLTYCQTI